MPRLEASATVAYHPLIALAVIGLIGELLFLDWLLFSGRARLTIELGNLFRIIVLGLAVLAIAGLLGVNVNISIILSGTL